MAKSKSASVWLATCLGVGWLPKAPGTWGSVVGLIAGALCVPLEWGTGLWLGCSVIDFVICVWVCSLAEKALGKTDPGEIVIDEVWAMAYVVILVGVGITEWPHLAVLFLLFRFFDIVKPYPLKLMARLPKGWGVMADDAGAAVFTLLTDYLLGKFLPF